MRIGTPKTRSSLRIDRQQLLVESADLALAVHEVNFQNPMSSLTVFVGGAHRQVAVGMDIQGHLVTGNFFMRKLPNQVPRDRTTVFPAVVLGQGLRVAVEFTSRDMRMLVKILLAGCNRLAYIPAQLAFHWIGT